MARLITIPKFTITVIGEDKKPTGEIQTVISTMINIMQTRCKMDAISQARFWRGVLPLVDAKEEEVVEIADSDFDEIKLHWFGISAEDMPVDRQVALITTMINTAEEKDAQ